MCLQLCVEFSVCESLTLASDMKDSLTTDALPAIETDLPDTVHSTFRKSSLPDGSQKTSKPPVPVFRKRTSIGNCVVADGSAAVHEQSAASRLLDSNKCDADLVLSSQRSPVKSNGLGADTAAVSGDKKVSLSSQQQATPSLLSAILATSAASIAMITIQAPSPMHSAAAKQKTGNSVVSVGHYSVMLVSLLVTKLEVVVSIM